MKSPVLFLVFNRPDTTRQVFEAIRAARPPRLYVAADGPRPDRPGEAEKCQLVREIATAVDWPCEVKTLFRDKNLGCKMGVSSGISWFFENEEEGIILEDDILPLPCFFDYCDELLERYRDDERVAMISGNNFVSRHREPQTESYSFSSFVHIWGWAAWRRSWVKYDVAMAAWSEWETSGGLQRILGRNLRFEQYWSDIFRRVYAGLIDTWDYQWVFTCWKMQWVAVVPKSNLVTNLGFGEGATHTLEPAPAYVIESSPVALDLPLRHPAVVARDAVLDKLIYSVVFDDGIKRHIKRCLKRLVCFNK